MQKMRGHDYHADEIGSSSMMITVMMTMMGNGHA